ncbi:MAG: pseudouridine synthase [Elusimicrobia bacterium]|nr:pseudouridine synthase [Elusimicrobiota bacterium]MDE2236634.1 pseudouridine synthase [Elusimicrobiota bacterium]MDE2425264.1 pseudouridine synthase [Elusimicrobiota bacterium]
MLLAFYKPYGVLSQFTPEHGLPSLSRFGLPKKVYPCGRLDKDSEGLLLLTDDGALAHRLTDPRFGHRRVYWAQVEGVPDQRALLALASGPILSDGPTRACNVTAIPEPNLPPRRPPIRFRAGIPTSWLELTLTEGRNRQVRRMTAAVGHPTLRLARWACGDVTLEGLAPGRWRRVEPVAVG